MNRWMLIIGAAVLGMALLAAAGCGSSTNGGVGADESSDPTFAFRGRPGHPHVFGPGSGGFSGTASSAGGGAPGTGGSGAAGVSSTPPAATDVQAVIAAAQNPDGTAIPQGPGPNGECPEVLVLLGFWSCPQIGQTCSYTLGATHRCQCDRLDGEGGLPAWVCDQ
jgi:hypothetical protein